MVLPKEITTNTWVKNWSSNWKTAFASLYWLYTTSLKSYNGKNLDINILVCEKESSSNFVAKEDLDTFSKYLAKKIVKDKSIGERMAKDTISTTDKLYEIIVLLKDKKNLNHDNLLELKKRFYLHIAPHFPMKKVLDYLPQELQKEFSLIFINARKRTEELDIFNNTDNILRQYAKMIAIESNYPEEIMDFLTIEEMIIYLNNKKLPTKEELTLRSNGLVIFCKKDKYTLLTGEDYKEFIKFIIGSNKTELKGNIGHRGKVKGIARIIFDPYNVKVFNDKDILVTGMTRPEFLPLMKKASAFVTDAGGMLSHAAIVARELKKPCILATETATKIIKDGDEIEVDADIGIVTILKRAL